MIEPLPGVALIEQKQQLSRTKQIIPLPKSLITLCYSTVDFLPMFSICNIQYMQASAWEKLERTRTCMDRFSLCVSNVAP